VRRHDATAKQGGGKYYRVSTEDAILKAITDILIEIQSTNSAFAATALPASATNRSVDQNQVYLGVFRPDAIAQPRWFGNLKRFQIILNNGSPDLGDATGVVATNSVNGFLKDCSASFWTKDTSAYKAAGTAPAATDPPYWSIVPITPTPTSACPGPSAVGWVNNPANPSDSASSAQFQPGTGITWSPYSDSPDGPSVEIYQLVDARLTPEVRNVLSVEGALRARSAVGGTAPERVAEQLAALTALVDRQTEWAGERRR